MPRPFLWLISGCFDGFLKGVASIGLLAIIKLTHLIHNVCSVRYLYIEEFILECIEFQE